MGRPSRFEGLDLVALNNAIARRHKDEVPRVEKFKSEDEGRAIVNTALQTTGEKFIRILEPDRVCRGAAAKRWQKYKDGMLVEDYADACTGPDTTRRQALQDVAYNDRKGFIKVYG